MLESERHSVPAYSGMSLVYQGCPLLRDAGEMQKSSNEGEPAFPCWVTRVGHRAAFLSMGWGVSKQELLELVGVSCPGPGDCLYHRHKSLQMPSPGAEDGLSLGVIHI